MSFRTAQRRLRFGLATVLGLARRGFFIPYRYAADLPPPGREPPYAPVERLFAAHADAFRSVLDEIARHGAALGEIGLTPPPEPRWNQSWFPRLDAAAAYALVRRHAPARIVEVGSGHSTRFLARAVRDGALATAITAIDPAPRADIAGLAPLVTLHRSTLRRAGLGPFEGLAAGDMVFIDSSHILMPGTDVDWLLNRLLPTLAPGVLVHVHDIFLPDDYPAAWGWRGYNEAQGVAALLTGGGWVPLFSSRWAATRMADAVAAALPVSLPLSPGAYETSLWLTRP